MTEILIYTPAMQLSQMFWAIFFFHTSEYILAVMIHGRSNVTLSSFLISKQYLMAMLFSLVEYFLELYFFPGLKDNWWISYLGLVMVIIGEIIRKLAILTAGQSFTHLIRVLHDRRHEFVTHGIYSFVRHPGYSGFLVWSVGTQVMMCSPVSTVAFAVVVWNFFAKRIPYEERFLRQFFGQEYVEYAHTVPSGIPFVK
ncbi:protein-S-isoprenylcysteine O-methyltransferase B-like [Impatiens glandulifera]|uniref:protein-S-isoprenylcysteine O-methyltransferase B-like n=1 Tax=Impatiens glandulifera TaxID=253017 RepID=UPI001FB19021|nr:protein-S-isoprenylcysteine O-methyltransferase B-like [Impatiens glandulifera]